MKPPKWDPDTPPPWTPEDVAGAALYDGARLVRPATRKLKPRAPGRPRVADPKPQVTIRLDRDVLDTLKASGKGWQTRANAMLRKALGLP